MIHFILTMLAFTMVLYFNYKDSKEEEKERVKKEEEVGRIMLTLGMIDDLDDDE